MSDSIKSPQPLVQTIINFHSAEEQAMRRELIDGGKATRSCMVDYLIGLDQEYMAAAQATISKMYMEVPKFNGEQWLKEVKEAMESRNAFLVEIDSIPKDADIKKPEKEKPAPSSKVGDIHNALLGKPPLRLYCKMALMAEFIKANGDWIERTKEIMEGLEQGHDDVDVTRLKKYIERIAAVMRDHS